MPHPPIRSYVLRQGRLTKGQRHAFETYRSRYLLPYDGQPVNLDSLFGRSAERVLEIGFGNGESLLEQALASPDKDFIGIEVHAPGVGHLMVEAERQGISNLRLFQYDAVEVLQACISDGALDVVQVFFPDPWPKKRHHKRRIIQPAFVELLITKLKDGGRLHCATDWTPYAEHMMEVLSALPSLSNVVSAGEYFKGADVFRPLTKFERRGLRLGHTIKDLVFEKRNGHTNS